jgi:hypothetical protein
VTSWQSFASLEFRAAIIQSGESLSRGSIFGKDRNFSLQHQSPHNFLFNWKRGLVSAVVKRPKCDLFTSTSVEVKNAWSFTFTPSIRLHGVGLMHKDDFTLHILNYSLHTNTKNLMAVFWVVAPCSLIEVYQRFRRPYCPPSSGRLPSASKDLWNVGKLLPDYTALQPRRQPS